MVSQVFMWLVLLMCPGIGWAATVNLVWTAPTTNADGSPLLDLAGYRLYQREPPAAYGSAVQPAIPSSTLTATVSNLIAGRTYAFVVMAYDTSGHESVASAELTHRAQALPVPSPVDSLTVMWQLVTTVTPMPNLILGYAFDEGTGLTVADRSGLGHEGTLIGGLTWGPGVFGSALEFTATPGHLTVAGLTAPAGSWTMSAWVKRTNTAYLLDVEAGRLIVSLGQWCSTPGRLCVYDAGGVWRMVTPVVPVGTWQHVAVVFNAATKKATGYLNGVVGSTVAYAATPLGGAVVIGSDYTGEGPYVGALDDVRLYNRALTLDEIKSVMGGGL